MAQAVLVKEAKAVEEVVNQKAENDQTASVIENKKSIVAPSEKKNRIQVSNNKKPLFFYLNLAKRYLKQYNEVELSALGMAIPTVVTIAEILKANGVATEKKVVTSTVGSKDENKGRLVQKAKIEIVLEKNTAVKNPQEVELKIPEGVELEVPEQTENGKPEEKDAAKFKNSSQETEANSAGGETLSKKDAREKDDE